jgi:hypothetical protein
MRQSLRILLFALTLAACSSPRAPQGAYPKAKATRHAPSPSVEALDRLTGGANLSSRPDASVEQCLQRVNRTIGCRPDPNKRHTINIRLVLDERYTTSYPQWQKRFERTIACVNRLYGPTILRWRLFGAKLWDPGERRYDLRALLDQLQMKFGPDNRSILLGITVWDEERVINKGGGEIGLSQGSSCVVPSWMRVENDCLILAHELGHLSGAEHVLGKNWIMSPSTSPFHLPAKDAVRRVVETFRFDPRNIAAINTLTIARFSTQNPTLQAACEERLKAIDRCNQIKY